MTHKNWEIGILAFWPGYSRRYQCAAGGAAAALHGTGFVRPPFYYFRFVLLLQSRRDLRVERPVAARFAVTRILCCFVCYLFSFLVISAFISSNFCEHFRDVSPLLSVSDFNRSVHLKWSFWFISLGIPTSPLLSRTCICNKCQVSRSSTYLVLLSEFHSYLQCNQISFSMTFMLRWVAPYDHLELSKSSRILSFLARKDEEESMFTMPFNLISLTKYIFIKDLPLKYIPCIELSIPTVD